MKPKEKSTLFDNLSCSFPPTHLYRADIEQIIQIGTSRELKVNISDSTAEFDDLDDVQENRGNRVKELAVSFSGKTAFSSISLKIGSGGITLRSSKDDALVLAWHDIKSAIERRVPFHARFMKPTLWLTTLFCIAVLENKFNILPSNEFFRIGTLIVPIYLWAISLYYVKSNGGVYLQKEHEVPSLWDRYGEKTVTLIAGAVIGAIVTAVSQKLLGK